MSKPAKIIKTETGVVVRCYSFEEQYAQMVIDDLIAKAVEEQSNGCI